MHDVNLSEHFGQYADLPDKIVALTNWHKEHTKKLYNLEDSRFAVVPNGINLERFTKDRSNDPSNDPKFIWLSSPDRGLETLLAMWPMIRELYPKATLDIFYGWVMIDKILDNYRSAGRSHGPLELLKNRVETQLEKLGKKSGINWAGRVSPDDLAKALYKSNFWLYPTAFMETFCISAIQAQAAGVIPVASDLAALKETVADKSLLIEGWPMNVDYQLRFMKTLDSVINNKERILEVRENSREFATTFSWDNAYSKWNDLFKELSLTY